jgi:hypothetical protein
LGLAFNFIDFNFPNKKKSFLILPPPPPSYKHHLLIDHISGKKSPMRSIEVPIDRSHPSALPV